MVGIIDKQPLNNLIRSSMAGIVPVPQIVVEDTKEINDYYSSYGTLLSLTDNVTAKTGYFDAATRAAVKGQILRLVAKADTSFRLSDTMMDKVAVGQVLSSISGSNITFDGNVHEKLCIGQTIFFTVYNGATAVPQQRTVSAISVGNNATITVTQAPSYTLVGAITACTIYAGIDVPMLEGDVLDLYIPNTYNICPSFGATPSTKAQLSIYVIG